MTIQQFNTFHRQRPFQPFAIHVADGRMFDVVHPENVSLSLTGRTVGVVNDEKLVEVLDMLLVTSLRPLPGR